jgi:hypothetical protein
VAETGSFKPLNKSPLLLAQQIIKGEYMAGTNLPHNLQQLLNDIEREWIALMHVVDQLTPEQMVTPDAGGWSPKDNLAHLAEWMKILLGYHMDKHPADEVVGVSPEVTRDWDMDVINKVLFKRNHSKPTEEVLKEFKQVYAEVVARLKATPFEDLMEPRSADDPEKQPLLNWVLGNTTAHFAEHRRTMEKIFAK